jgi:hypothetical protein
MFLTVDVLEVDVLVVDVQELDVLGARRYIHIEISVEIKRRRINYKTPFRNHKPNQFHIKIFSNQQNRRHNFSDA